MGVGDKDEEPLRELRKYRMHATDKRWEKEGRSSCSSSCYSSVVVGKEKEQEKKKKKTKVEEGEKEEEEEEEEEEETLSILCRPSLVKKKKTSSHDYPCV